ncbi:TetR/AcrR family transcriptional regulator [Oerskovia jenensis]|uniref:TetR/AcrR family transcriptional regulator n=1 Tax=Oerskovia jenensis TaxID=162169 RepID=UPI0036D90DFE
MSDQSQARRIDPRMARSRRTVLAATVEVLAERGVAGTTIEAVAERSGVAKTTIYRQWDDQPALVRDAFASTLETPPAPDTGTLRGDLLALVDGLARALSFGPAASIMSGLIDAAQREPAFAELHATEAALRHRVVLEVIERAVRRGELAEETDPALALDLIAGPVFHRRWVTGRPVDREMTTRVVDATLAALGPCSAPGTPTAAPRP